MTLIFSNTDSELEKAAILLREGKLVAFGTETVYGLGADATNAQAVQRIYQAKGRPNYNPLIIHFAEIEDVFKHVQKTELAFQLANHFWPGPLTLILQKRAESSVCSIATAGLSTMAVRIPAVTEARKIIALSQKPIAAPSANPSGKVSPSTAQHVIEGLNGKIDAIIDSGPCKVGVESTILDISGAVPCLLRPGGLSIEDLRPYCEKIESHLPINNATIRSPGQLSSHYAPSLPIRLNCHEVYDDEALLAFGRSSLQAKLSRNLSFSGDLNEAAQNLFAALRFLDSEGRRIGLKRIAVMPIPDTGIGLAICDRLQRAAAPRPL